jgi:tetratricopeptide (TPR) repeat protein
MRSFSTNPVFAITGAALCAIALLFTGAPTVAAGDDQAVSAISAALRARHFQEAVELADSALRNSPKEVRILVLKGMALSSLGNDGAALTVLRSALAAAPDYVPALEAAAQIEYRQGRPEASADLQHLLALRPHEQTAHAMLGALAWKASDCDSAVRHFSQAETVIAAQFDALSEFGTCLMRLKRPAEATAVFRKLAVLRPDDHRAIYALAVSLMDVGHNRDAIAALEPLAARSDATALELTSSALEALGETPQAVADLRQAVLLDRRNVDLYLDFANLSFTHQSFQVGIDMIDAGLKQLPDAAALYLARGVLYVQLADYAKADADFDKAERLDPARALGSVARGLSQIQQNNLDKALVTIRAQLKSNPKDAFPYYVLAELLSRQGARPGSSEFRQAVDAASEAVRLKPDFVLARDVLSRLYLEAGEPGKAIEQCRLALRDKPDDEMAVYRLIRALQSSGDSKAAAEVPALLKRFTALREHERRRQEHETQYRLVEVAPARQ